jgi:hypothetical protein
MTCDIHGQFVDVHDGSERLILSFAPGLLPLQQRWRNNGLSADFMGDYVTAFFPRDDADPTTIQRQEEIKGAVSYIANELLENAMKYNDNASAELIKIELILTAERIILTLSNHLSDEQASAFVRFIHRLEQSDADTMYMEQLEANAMTGSSSGLGLLTMINDYNAALAWRFSPNTRRGVDAQTQVTLAV